MHSRDIQVLQCSNCILIFECFLWIGRSTFTPFSIHIGGYTKAYDSDPHACGLFDGNFGEAISFFSFL